MKQEMELLDDVDGMRQRAAATMRRLTELKVCCATRLLLPQKYIYQVYARTIA